MLQRRKMGGAQASKEKRMSTGSVQEHICSLLVLLVIQQPGEGAGQALR